MPRAIADSDDENEELVSEVSQRKTDATLPKSIPTLNAESASQSPNQSNVKGTGSTENLRREIQKAERRLLTNCAAETNMDRPPLSSMSPSVQATKRRHTSVAGSDSVTSGEKSIKRTKTMKTYGSKSQTVSKAGHQFESVKDHEIAPRTSQSARFTEHSSGLLPPGTMEDEFVNHEPNVMFRESGSTIPDDSSTQQRLLEQALQGKADPQAHVEDPPKTGASNSSSLLWSQSELNDAGKQDTAHQGSQTATRDDDIMLDDVDNADSTYFENDSITVGEPQQPRPNKAPQVNSKAEKLSRHPGSPTVEILQQKNDAVASAQETSASTQKTQRAHRRKSKQDDDGSIGDDDAAILVSDDRPIGLPKEQYQPRPSKRRATQIIEPTIDYSVRPEKAAKVKRTKTTDASVNSTAIEADLTGSPHLPVKDPPPQKADANEQPLPQAKQGPSEKELGTVATPQIPDPPSNAEQQTEKPSSHRETIPPAKANLKSDDEIFVVPPKPTPKTKPGSKAKRSQTTIWEDHVQFKGSQRSPNLSQQQAARQSALQPLQNEKASQKKRRSVVVDDDEDDDSAAAKPDGENEADSTSKKRQRGRPAKPTTNAQPESVEKASEEPEPEKEKEKSTEVDDAPAKRGRGRPPKTSDGSKPNMESTSKQQLPEKTIEVHPTIESDTSDVQIAAETSNAAITTTKLPTPPSEKQAASEKVTKPSPTSHSPIKSTSHVPYRVGLSKRHRIPSLLRTMNPKR